jgi:hypothetical protein
VQVATRWGSVAFFSATLIACGNNASTEPGDASIAAGDASTGTPATDAGRPPFFVEPCTDGPRWPNGSQFQYEVKGPTDAPACTPHCGPNASASSLWGSPDLMKLTSAALPSGACQHEGNTCTMAAEWLGPCPPSGRAVGPFDLFICRCTSGRWGCTVDGESPSATSQTCELPDGAGADAGP